MPDAHFLVVLRRRLLFPVCELGATCKHRTKNGRVCGAPLDSFGMHALCCGIGGARVHRHNSLRDWAASMYTDCVGAVTNIEQHVPEWDVVDPDSGETEQAILDVATRDPFSGETLYLDTTVTCELTTSLDRRQARARRNGVAVAATAKGKHRRYPPLPGRSLVALAFEAGGRPAEETTDFVRMCGSAWGQSHGAHEDDPGQPATARLWQECATLLQIGNAEMLLSAAGR